jgi:predicted ribosome quality control (RQC) complex YloA/Tae2 family protein
MQPFDALSIRAVLQEAKPLLINRKVDRVYQLGRDELLISLRSKGGAVSLFLSAQSVYGRMCLVRIPSSEAADKNPQERLIFERYQSKYSAGAPPAFCLVLRKHLSGATLVGVEQLPGERIIDFIFSATDEVGSTSLKVLTAEIMGRHSNLIFWDKESEKILASSHAVTREMSRQREVLPNLKYERPPGQDRQSIFSVSETEFKTKLKELQENFSAQKPAVANALEPAGVGAKSQSEHGGINTGNAPGAVASARKAGSPAVVGTAGDGTTDGDGGGAKPAPVTYEQWLLSTFTGLGKHLSEETIVGSGVDSMLANSLNTPQVENILWKQISKLQTPSHFKPALKADLSRYTVLGWYPDFEQEGVWTKFPSVNDVVEFYFRSLEAREQFIQLREKIKAEINAESNRLETRKQVASGHLSAEGEIDRLKKSGDNILASLHAIKAGQTEVVVQDWTEGNGKELTIQLNPNLSSVQNAQVFYRQYAKLRSRQGAAQSTIDEVTKRLDYLGGLRKSCDEAKDIAELRRVKETLSGRKVNQERNQERSNKGDPKGPQQQRQKSGGAGGGKPKSLSLVSSDGWTIFVGRNRHENDHLLSKVANPNDLWFHVLGQGGSHVLIRVPSNKQEPPKTTIMEAAHIAARLSKAGTGVKVRVIYTQCKHVKKTDPNKPGLVRYENEKTVEVDTATPMPKMMKKLFSN